MFLYLSYSTGLLLPQRSGSFASLTKPATAGYWFTQQASLGKGTAAPSHHPLVRKVPLAGVKLEGP
jgi:hypothetical protein